LFYKEFKGKYWKSVTLLTLLFFPLIIFLIFILMNVILYTTTNSTITIPYFTILLLLFTWLIISTPLVILGGYLGFHCKLKNKSNVYRQPKIIPTQPWYKREITTILIGGLIPFGVIFIEVYFIMSSIWFQKYYFTYGFTLLVFALYCMSLSEVTIIFIYTQLCSLNHKWYKYIINKGCGIHF
jgi:transmembrane 9 superfamily protein 2/4